MPFERCLDSQSSRVECDVHGPPGLPKANRFYPTRAGLGAYARAKSDRAPASDTRQRFQRTEPTCSQSNRGRGDPTRFVTASETEDGSVAIAYLPRGGTISLRGGLERSISVLWFNPRSGDWIDAGSAGAEASLTAPDDNDWVLCMRASGSRHGRSVKRTERGHGDRSAS
ncbi:MAG: hypothetical protein JTT11_08360 [Candidatus Brockarchaeota archaeon]|nr:hypothetical protein [Candidatus Brockarchaeota archaeon]